LSDSQRSLLIGALVLVGLVLAFVMLEWGTELERPGGDTVPIVTFYDEYNPRYPSPIYRRGIYTRRGIPGVLLGLVAPISLFAAAAYIALGKWKSEHPKY
jgi:hypothetical protein